MRTALPLLFVMAFLLPGKASGQCSDAGICSIGGVEEMHHRIILTAGLSHGASTDDDYRFTDVHLGVQGTPTDDLFLSISIPYRSMSGPLGSTAGIGDLLLTGQFVFWEGEDLSIAADAGIRFATGAINEGGFPQAYQPGLGTTDGLFGLSAIGDGWSMSAGYQYAPGRSANSVNSLRRGDDISLRGMYVFLKDDMTVSGEVLLIHKLQTSDGSYLRTGTTSPVYVPGGSGIPDTDRTQINLVGDISYPVGEGISVAVRGAVALLARPVNVDGLKRNFTIQAGCSIPVL